MLRSVVVRSFRKRWGKPAFVAEWQRSSSGKLPLERLKACADPSAGHSSNRSSPRGFSFFSSVASLDYYPSSVHDNNNNKTNSLIAYTVPLSQHHQQQQQQQQQKITEQSPILEKVLIEEQHPFRNLKGEETQEEDLVINLQHGNPNSNNNIKNNNRNSNSNNNSNKSHRKQQEVVGKYPMEEKGSIKSSKFYHQQVILGKLKRELASAAATTPTNSRGISRRIQSLFEQSKALQIDLTPDMYAQCIQSFIQHHHLLGAGEALQDWIQLSKRHNSTMTPPSLDIFLSVVDAIGYNAKLPYHQQIKGTDGLYSLIKDLIQIIQTNFLSDSDIQQRVLPQLLLNIVQYKINDASLAAIAHKLYQYLMRRQRQSSSTKTDTSDPISTSLPSLLIPLDPQLYKEILYHSANQGYCYLPVDEILFTLVFDYDVTVDAETVMTLLQKEFPFLDMNRVVRYLDCIEKLSSKNTATADEFRLDIGLLEQIMIRAARKRLPDIVQRGWNFIERYQYLPTETMYESAMHAFFLAYKSDHFGFAVMKEMEHQSGYIPSYALIRTVSRCLRTSTSRIDNAYYILASDSHKYITLASMNCILSAYGQVGGIESAFATFDDLLEHGLDPDSNSFSFLLEALATHVKSCVVEGRSKANNIERAAARAEEDHKHDSQEEEDGDEEDLVTLQQQRRLTGESPMDFSSFIEAAEDILEMMEERGIELDHRILHQYIRLLVYAGETVRAKGVLEDVLAKKTCRICLATFSMVSFQLAAFEGNIELGREVANMILEAGYRQIPPSLQQKLMDAKNNSIHQA